MQDELRNILVVDPRQSGLYSVDNSTYLIQKSAQTISYTTNGPQTSTVNQISHNVTVPSKSVIVDRKAYMDMEVSVRLRGRRADTVLFYPDNQFLNGPGPGTSYNVEHPHVGGGSTTSYLGSEFMGWSVRSSPLMRCSASATIYINGLLISQLPEQYFPQLQLSRFYGTDEPLKSASFGGLESMQMVNMESGAGNISSSSLSGYETYNFYNPKNNDPVQVYLVSQTAAVGNGGIVEAIFKVKWVEQVELGPFCQHNMMRDSPGLIGINQLQLTWNISSWNKMFLVTNPFNFVPNAIASSDPNTFYSMEVTSVDKADLKLCYITPSPILGSLPNTVQYDVPLYQNFQSNTQPLLRTGFTKVTLNNIQLSSIPAYIVIFATKDGLIDQEIVPGPPSNKYLNNIIASSCVGEINNISINFNNQTALLSSASQHDLFHMSCRNGLNMSWSEWKKRKGSIILLDFSKDIGSDALSAVGVSGQFQFQLDAYIRDATDSLSPTNGTDGSNVAYNYKLNCLVINQGLLQISPSVCRLTDSYDVSTVLAAVSRGDIQVSDIAGDVNGLQTGGSIWSGLQSLKGYIRPWAQKLSENLPKLQEAYSSSFIPQVLPKSYKKNIDRGFTLSNYVMSMVNKMLGEGMSGGAIKKILKEQLQEPEFEALKQFLKMQKGAALVGGKQVAKKRLVKKY